jgi:hypothetical protein
MPLDFSESDHGAWFTMRASLWPTTPYMFFFHCSPMHRPNLQGRHQDLTAIFGQANIFLRGARLARRAGDVDQKKPLYEINLVGRPTQARIYLLPSGRLQSQHQ